jgi:hypothetical protein
LRKNCGFSEFGSDLKGGLVFLNVYWEKILVCQCGGHALESCSGLVDYLVVGLVIELGLGLSNLVFNIGRQFQVL